MRAHCCITLVQFGASSCSSRYTFTHYPPSSILKLPLSSTASFSLFPSRYHLPFLYILPFQDNRDISFSFFRQGCSGTCVDFISFGFIFVISISLFRAFPLGFVLWRFSQDGHHTFIPYLFLMSVHYIPRGFMSLYFRWGLDNNAIQELSWDFQWSGFEW